jgi:hypothetical protein
LLDAAVLELDHPMSGAQEKQAAVLVRRPLRMRLPQLPISGLMLASVLFVRRCVDGTMKYTRIFTRISWLLHAFLNPKSI